MFITAAILKCWTDDSAFLRAFSNYGAKAVKYVQMMALEETSRGHKNLYNSPSGDHEFLQQMSSKCSL